MKSVKNVLDQQKKQQIYCFTLKKKHLDFVETLTSNHMLTPV